MHALAIDFTAKIPMFLFAPRQRGPFHPLHTTTSKPTEASIESHHDRMDPVAFAHTQCRFPIKTLNDSVHLPAQLSESTFSKSGKHMAKTMSKTVRVTDEQWNRIETAVGNSKQSPNHLLVQLAMEALDHHEWPRTDLEIRLLRSTLFTAEVTARNMIAEGRAKEVEEIRQKISTFVTNHTAAHAAPRQISTERS